jgi:hypothetical protein
LSNHIKLSSIHSFYIIIQDLNTSQQKLQRPVGPVMEEFKQDQGPGEGAAGTNIVKPDKAYKPAPGKAPTAKNTSDVKRAMVMSRNKGKEAV